MSGFLESVGNVCKGTLVVLCTPVLIPHAVYRNKCARRVPFAAEIEDEAMDEGRRKELRERRRELLEGMQDLIGGRANESAESRLTEDVEFEDPFQRYRGRREMTKLLAFCRKHFKEVDFEVRRELHAESEVLMDWTLHIRLSSTTVHLPMYTQIKLASSTTYGNYRTENVCKIQENWNGRSLSDTSNTTPRFLGWLQMGLRRGVGWFGSKLI